MGDEKPLPTLGEVISGWLGFQLPAIPMPQTIKNLDKAVGKILLAAGENAEARIKASTGKAKAKGKIAVEGLYGTEEEKRKIENRAAAVSVAVEDLNSNAQAADASSEIDDDWLNLFARLAEDKSSEELQGLFGRILSGEIRRPGSFSLRTIQFVSTLSKEDAHAVSSFLSFALSKRFVPFVGTDDVAPNISTRINMQELGLASNASAIGGLAWKVTIAPGGTHLSTGVKLGIVVENRSSQVIAIEVECQVLSRPAQELIEIANPPAADLEFLKTVSQVFFEKIKQKHAEALLSGTIKVLVAALEPAGGDRFRYHMIYTATMPSQ